MVVSCIVHLEKKLINFYPTSKLSSRILLKRFCLRLLIESLEENSDPHISLAQQSQHTFITNTLLKFKHFFCSFVAGCSILIFWSVLYKKWSGFNHLSSIFRFESYLELDILRQFSDHSWEMLQEINLRVSCMKKEMFSIQTPINMMKLLPNLRHGDCSKTLLQLVLVLTQKVWYQIHATNGPNKRIFSFKLAAIVGATYGLKIL